MSTDELSSQLIKHVPNSLWAQEAAKAAGAHCDICPLKGNTIVGPSPNTEKLRLVIVGEGPGRVEEKVGAPFVGQSGKLLDRLLSVNGIRRGTCYITNAALCRGEGDKENEKAAECCAPRLLGELGQTSGPIVTLGKTATSSVLGIKNLFLARGFIWQAKEIDEAHLKAARAKAERRPKRDEWSNLKSKGAHQIALEEFRLKAESLVGRAALAGRTVLPTVHPAFVLRSDSWHPVIEIDFRRIGRVVCGEAKDEAFEGGHHVGGLELLGKLRGKIISLDVETDGVKPLETKLLCVGMSDGEATVVIYPWKAKYAKKLAGWLRTRELVVAHNLNFDRMVLEANGVMGEARREIAYGDSLVAHHAIASHFFQRLDWLVSEYCDSSPWKIHFGRKGAKEKGLAPKDMPGDELCLYNAADARLTALAWRRLQDDLLPELHTYKHDMEVFRLCRQMMAVGIGVDQERRAMLDGALKARAAGLKGRMRRLLRKPEFRPGSIPDCRLALFKTLRSRYTTLTKSGVPSTSDAALEALQGDETRAGHFTKLLLQWRVVMKIRSTYVAPCDPEDEDTFINPNTKRAHYSWNGITKTGRLTSRFQSVPRYVPKSRGGNPEDWVRELYVPRKGNRFLYYDVSQSQMRLAAYLSADPVFMEACRGDVHGNNAKLVFPNEKAKGWLDGDSNCPKCRGGDERAKCSCPIKDPGRGKPFRDICKNLGFAIIFAAEADKLFITLRRKGFSISLSACQVILALLHSNYKMYYRYVQKNIAEVERCGFMRSPILGRIWWLGWHPELPDVSCFPVQSAEADIVKMRMIEIDGRMRKNRMRANLVADVHDSNIFDVPVTEVEDLRGIVSEVWGRPIDLPGGKLVLPIEMKVGDRMSDFG